MFTFYIWYSIKYTGQYIVTTFSTFRTGPVLSRSTRYSNTDWVYILVLLKMPFSKQNHIQHEICMFVSTGRVGNMTRISSNDLAGVSSPFFITPSLIHHSSSTAQNYWTILSGAGAHGECATFEVWVGANGPEFIELDEILDRFVEPSNLLT
jgi:hypothetical protein